MSTDDVKDKTCRKAGQKLKTLYNWNCSLLWSTHPILSVDQHWIQLHFHFFSCNFHCSSQFYFSTRNSHFSCNFLVILPLSVFLPLWLFWSMQYASIMQLACHIAFPAAFDLKPKFNFLIHFAAQIKLPAYHFPQLFSRAYLKIPHFLVLY